MTILIKDQSQSIEQASFVAQDLFSQISEAAAAAKSWNESFLAGNTAAHLLADGVLGAFSVMVVNWGLPPSMIRNIVLFFGGRSVLEK